MHIVWMGDDFVERVVNSGWRLIRRVRLWDARVSAASRLDGLESRFAIDRVDRAVRFGVSHAVDVIGFTDGGRGASRYVD
jgi:hypothetical protein